MKPRCPDYRTHGGHSFAWERTCVPEGGRPVNERMTSTGELVQTWRCVRCGGSWQNTLTPAEHFRRLQHLIADRDEVYRDNERLRQQVFVLIGERDEALARVDELENGATTDRMVV